MIIYDIYTYLCVNGLTKYTSPFLPPHSYFLYSLIWFQLMFFCYHSCIAYLFFKFIYYTPFARSHVLLWKFMYQNSCNIYTNRRRRKLLLLQSIFCRHPVRDMQQSIFFLKATLSVASFSNFENMDFVLSWFLSFYKLYVSDIIYYLLYPV